MKKFFFVGIISLLFTGNAVASGSGDIKLSDRVVNNLQRYIQFEKPVVFLVTIDGQNSTGWRCPHQECVARGAMNEKKLCERKYGKPCNVFVSRRTIKWKNVHTLKLKSKDRKFNSKDSLYEVKSKLTKLGFYGEQSNSPEAKIDSISDELQKLKKLYDDKVISESEFVKLKKKLIDN